MIDKVSIIRYGFRWLKVAVFFSAMFFGKHNNLSAQKTKGEGLFGRCHTGEFFHYYPNQVHFCSTDSSRVINKIQFWIDDEYDDPTALKYPYYEELHVVFITNSFEGEDLRFQRCQEVEYLLKRSFPELVVKYEFKSDDEVELSWYNERLIDINGRIVGALFCMRSFYIVD